MLSLDLVRQTCTIAICASNPFHVLLSVSDPLVLKEVLRSLHYLTAIVHYMLPASYVPTMLQKIVTIDLAWLAVTYCKRVKIIVSTLLYWCTISSISPPNTTNANNELITNTQKKYARCPHKDCCI